ncbi:unnamed protein product [Spirodela intermedia]|uniref:Uncharacterized protein n=1 Tax=Spirodela intermedia TaxID=51605 RepID=A0A7I8JMT2_SPIIN|nr:unnamed protein product [Spirodela intermedia]CAA6671111.1 unnamed protein product [Spirodela intermedia]
MGLIEDGAVSGVLPEAECFAVHYPGYPASVSRAVETLGGLEEIGKKRSLGTRRVETRPENRNDSRLELRFRPEDPYCHPAFGDLRPCSGLLLKVSKKRKKTKKKKKKKKQNTNKKEEVKRQESSENGDAEQGEFHVENEASAAESVQLSCSIVARVHHAYRFDGLADYQFVVPVHAAKSRQTKRRWDDVEPIIENGGLMDMEQDEMVMLVPKLFSTKDMPDEILLRPSVGSVSKQKQQQQQQAVEEHNWEMDIAPCLKLSYEIAGILFCPTVPAKVNWEDHIPKDSFEWEWQMAVSKLFDERPIWPRWSLLERLLDDGVAVSYNQLRRLLPRSGFYFSTGPFGQFWIRKGYDPRIDPESRVMKQTWKDICRFQAFPKKSCTLQLFELHDEYIQQKMTDTPQQTTCTHSTGWFSRSTFELLSLRVKIRFLSVFPRKGAQKLLKSLRERFEKLKRLEILNREQGRDGQDGDSNKGLQPGHADCADDGFAANEAEDNSEEGEEEEELDEYGSQPRVIRVSIYLMMQHCFLLLRLIPT